MRVQCSTCLELLTPGDDLTCTPCGHVFHLACVVQWFENKKNCPQCRHTANERTLRKIYLAETDGETKEDADTLQNKLDNVQFQVRLKDTEMSKLSDRNKELEGLLKGQKDEIKKLDTDKKHYKSQTESLKQHVKMLNEERRKYDEAMKETQELRLKLDKMKSVELAIKGQEGDLNQFLHERGAFDRKTQDIATLVVCLKKKLAEVKKERSAYESKMRESISKHEGEKRKVRDLQVQLAESESGNKILEKDLWRCQEDLRSVTEKLENGGGADLTTTNISTNDTMPLPMSSPLKDLSPSPPPLSQSSYKLPSYKLVGSVKRALSPEQDDEERSPFMPIMNHKSKRLATDQGPARCVKMYL